MKKTASVRLILPALTLGLLLAACDGGSPVDTSTPVTALTDSGAGSLRQAIADAKAGDTLKFTSTGTVSLDAPITTDKNLTIIATGVTIDAAGKGRVLEVPAGVTVTVQGGTLTGGVGSIIATSLKSSSLYEKSSTNSSRLSAQAGTAQPTFGGVILNSGNLNLDGVTVNGGKANLGGGIANRKDATLTLKGTASITGNQAIDLDNAADDVAYGEGGGIHNAGTLVIEGGSIASNTAVYSGGGIRTISTGSLTIKGGNFESNSCTYQQKQTDQGVTGCLGGALDATSDVNITGGTFKANTASMVGGAISLRARYAADGKTVLYSTLNISDS